MKHIFLLLALVCSLTAAAKGDRYTRVYMFGVATTFTDSVVIFTDVMGVDSAFVSKNGILSERSLYSFQLESYLENLKDKPNATVAVFWDEDRKKVEKKFLKVRRRFLKDSTTKIESLPSTEFRFMHVEHFDALSQ